MSDLEANGFAVAKEKQLDEKGGVESHIVFVAIDVV